MTMTPAKKSYEMIRMLVKAPRVATSPYMPLTT